MVMEEEVKRRTAKRKAALFTEIIQGKPRLPRPVVPSVSWRIICRRDPSRYFRSRGSRGTPDWGTALLDRLLEAPQRSQLLTHALARMEFQLPNNRKRSASTAWKR